MQFEQLQQQWQRLDQKLEQTLKIESELLRLTVTRAARSRINRLAIWPALDIVLCVAILIFCGFFLSDHWSASSLAAPIAVVVVAAVMLMIDSIRQLECVSKIDWDGKVVNIQSALSRLRIAKVRQFKWVILLSPLVGFCALVVGLQWLLDRLPEQHVILDKLNPWWVGSNYAFGLLFVLFGHVIIGFLAKRFGNRGWWQRVLDGVSGTSMTKARAELDRWTSLNDAGVETSF